MKKEMWVLRSSYVCARWWQDVDFSTNPHFILGAGTMCHQSHFALLSLHERRVMRWTVCKKRRTQRKWSGGRQRWASEEESTFWDRGVSFGRGEVCFPRGTITFHLNISKMLFKPTSERPPPAFTINTLICLRLGKKRQSNEIPFIL